MTDDITQMSETEIDRIREEVEVLTFDVFETLLVKQPTFEKAYRTLLADKDYDADPFVFQRRVLAKHFRNNLMDSVVDTPHTPFKENYRRALVFRLKEAGIEFTEEEVAQVVSTWKNLPPHEETNEALKRLQEEYKIAWMSNGDPDILAALNENSFEIEPDAVFSSARAGRYKPHPDTYQRALDYFDVAPHEVGHVNCHSNDSLGSHTIGNKVFYIDRSDARGMEIHVFDEFDVTPDIWADDLAHLADILVGEE